jgi:hypothetical protein
MPLQNKLHFSWALFRLNCYTNTTSHPTCIVCVHLQSALVTPKLVTI